MKYTKNNGFPGLIVCASFLLLNVEPVRSFDFSCYFPIHGKKASTSTLP